MVGRYAALLTHLPNKDPDEPQATREDDEERVEEEVQDSVVTAGHSGVLS